MTLENEQYGSGWHKCFVCGVKDRADQLQQVGDRWWHTDVKASTCAEWKATLAKAKPRDVVAAGKRKR